MSEGPMIQTSNYWLLLLPHLPSELSLATFKVAFEPGLTAAFRDASSLGYQSKKKVILEVGTAYNDPIGSDYIRAQSVIALLYELACVISVREKIDIAYDNDIDVRFFFFFYSRDPSFHGQDVSEANSTSIIFPTLNDLAQSRRRWDKVLSIHSETGEGILQTFLKTRRNFGGDKEPSISRLPGGVAVIKPDRDEQTTRLSARQLIGSHQSVAVGGTFDHLHAGHKLLLAMTLLCCCIPKSEKQDQSPILTAGITGDELLKNKKYKDLVEDWPQRAQSVRCFLRDSLVLLRPHLHIDDLPKIERDRTPLHREEHFGGLLTLRCVEILDPFGPTITDQTISALVISAETRSGAQAINDRRQKKGWPELAFFEVGVLNATGAESGADAGDFEHKLSSTEIRSRIHQRAARNE